jgi:hypothetical protein
VANSSIQITHTDVAHAGIASVNHINVANTKMEIIRCCTTVSPSIPKLSVGKQATTTVAMMEMKEAMNALLLNLLDILLPNVPFLCGSNFLNI